MRLSVLFSSVGRRVELIECFRTDANELGIDLRVVAADSKPEWSSACAVADLAVKVPRCTSEEFIPRMLDLCKKDDIRLIIPTIDTELQMFSDHSEHFEAIGTCIAVSSPEVVRMARDKRQTMNFLKSHGIPVPRTESVENLLSQPESWQWPVVLKPVGGSSSVGLHVAKSIEDARVVGASGKDYLVQEHLKGREYTVNIYFDRKGRFCAAVPHLRQEIRTGEVSKGVTERKPVLMEMASRMGQVLSGAFGALCFQAIVNEQGQAAVIEINARFGGGYPLAHKAGARFSKWLLEETMGMPSSANNEWEEDVVMLRYDAAVFKKRTRILNYSD